MLLVNSVSGGKTSSYMAIHYPADVNIFALVLTEHPAAISKDKYLIAEVRRRVPHFVASHESDETLRAVLELDNKLGSPVVWVASRYPLESYVMGETDIPRYRTTPMLFNKSKRFCTVEQKIKPIAEWLYVNHGTDPVCMQIGFRADEPSRVTDWKCSNDKIKMPISCNTFGTKMHKYLSYEWRVPVFPLYNDGIAKDFIDEYWKEQPFVFPLVSNCRFCFNHTDLELAQQYQENPALATWWAETEEITGHTYGTRPIMERIRTPQSGQRKAICHCTD
jgi:hypothetical protein